MNFLKIIADHGKTILININNISNIYPKQTGGSIITFIDGDEAATTSLSVCDLEVAIIDANGLVLDATQPQTKADNSQSSQPSAA